MKCLVCQRKLLEHTDNWYEEFSVNCGGDCVGCCAVMEGLAVHAWCAFHERECVVAKHYEGSTHLCSRGACIEKQDITTLMINHSYANWKAGEENEFFERMESTSTGLANGTITAIDLSNLSDEAFITALLRRD